MIKNCSVQACSNPSRSRHLCKKHYTRLLRRGTTKRRQYSWEWIRDLLKRDEFGESCIEWPFGKNSNGYGTVNRQGASGSHLAHRHVLELSKGASPLMALHKCDNPSCVNPNHLEWGSQADNLKQAWSRNRMPFGESCAQAKLCNDDVRAIRKDHRTQIKIAKDYGVSRQLISSIKRRKKWSRVV